VLRNSHNIVQIEGFHALKHALRFGADVLEIEAADRDEVIALAERLAPDLTDVLAERVTRADADRFEGITGRVVARARRPAFDAMALLARPGPGPVVLLDQPRHLGNVGAAIRVAAAAGADGLVTTGTADPWHPVAVRGAAGLQFALPVGRLENLADLGGRMDAIAPAGGRGEGLPSGGRPVVALDPDGDALDPWSIPEGAILAFGSERHGLSDEIRAAADTTVALPMTPGVSSINLAAAVAATLYALRLGAG
jgi:TrmH family RNA methyltransferase